MSGPSDSIRAFIAVELNQAIKDIVQSAIKSLQESEVDVKWVNAQNAHLTLKFLGNISVDKIPLIRQALQDISRQTLPFVIATEALGAFPSLDTPRVIWLGLKQGHDELKNCARKIENALNGLGFAKESRAFSGHITVGRIKSQKNLKNLASLLKEKPFGGAETQEVKALTLFKSTLTSNGPVYDAIEAFSFAEI